MSREVFVWCVVVEQSWSYADPGNYSDPEPVRVVASDADRAVAAALDRKRKETWFDDETEKTERVRSVRLVEVKREGAIDIIVGR